MQKYCQAYKKVTINKKDWWRAKIMSVCHATILLAMRFRRLLTGVKIVNYNINRRGVSRLHYLPSYIQLGGAS